MPALQCKIPNIGDFFKLYTPNIGWAGFALLVFLETEKLDLRL